MDGQLRLTAEGTGAEPVVLDVDLPPELLERIRLLRDGERMEFEIRAPAALHELVAGIGYIAELCERDLRFYITDVERDLFRAKGELAKRYDSERCPECHVHERNGHTLGCSVAERAAHDET